MALSKLSKDFLRSKFGNFQRKLSYGHSCFKCQTTFSTKDDLGLHHLIHSGEIPFSCTICGKCFLSREILFYHTKKHKVWTYLCDVCSTTITSDNDRERHVKMHNNSSFHICKICGKAIFDICEVPEHTDDHFSYRRYMCKICGDRHFTVRHLQDHQERHFPARYYRCFICDAVCMTVKSLEKHEATHYTRANNIETITYKWQEETGRQENNDPNNMKKDPWNERSCIKMSSTLKWVNNTPFNANSHETNVITSNLQKNREKERKSTKIRQPLTPIKRHANKDCQTICNSQLEFARFDGSYVDPIANVRNLYKNV